MGKKANSVTVIIDLETIGSLFLKTKTSPVNLINSGKTQFI